MGLDFKSNEDFDSDEDTEALVQEQVINNEEQVVKNENAIIKNEDAAASEYNEKYDCEDCGKSFRLASGLRTHSIKHGKRLKCEVCGKEFNCKLLFII